MKLEKEVQLDSLTIQYNDSFVLHFGGLLNTEIQLKICRSALAEFGLVEGDLLGSDRFALLLVLDNDNPDDHGLWINKLERIESDNLFGGHDSYTEVTMKASFTKMEINHDWHVEQFEVGLTEQEYQALKKLPDNGFVFSLAFKVKSAQKV